MPAPEKPKASDKPFQFSICHNERTCALCVVFDYRFGDIIFVRAVAAAVVFRSETRHKAYTAQIEPPVRFRQIFGADTVEYGFTDVEKIFLGHAGFAEPLNHRLARTFSTEFNPNGADCQYKILKKVRKAILTEAAET